MKISVCVMSVLHFFFSQPTLPDDVSMHWILTIICNFFFIFLYIKNKIYIYLTSIDIDIDSLTSK